LLARGMSLRAACERVGVNRGQFQRALALERTRHASGTGAVAAAEAAYPSAAPEAQRPSAPRPEPSPSRRGFARLYDPWRPPRRPCRAPPAVGWPPPRLYARGRRRRHEPAWAAVPGPRLQHTKPVLRLEHLALLTDAERRALFAAPADREVEA